jgi:large subunit ribosomal protein L13
MYMTTTLETHIINADGKRLGDIATEAARILLGKTSVNFTRHTAAPVSVVIENVSRLDISEKKARETYQTYSGYPGGRRVETLGRLATRRGYSEVVRRTVAGMLPNNKLKRVRLANLTITE